MATSKLTKINSENMVSMRMKDEILERLDARRINLKAEMGINVSRQQLILAAVESMYLVK